ncbi:hypothetical protein HZB02_07105 [Candidatus Woesearchaeota archaeon]|nr:hypothetical protein [Candidatus Woesearchaeota archaeon]
MKLLDVLTSALHAGKKKSLALLWMVAADLSFLLLYGFVTSIFYAMIATHLSVLSAEVAKQSSALGRENVVAVLFSNSETSRTLLTLGLLFLLYFVVVFLAYCIIEGMAWWLSRQEGHWVDYLKKFSLLHLFWAPVLIVLFFLTKGYQFLSAASLRAGNPEPWVLGYLLGIVILGVGFMMLIGYAGLFHHRAWQSFKESWKWKHWKNYGLVFLLMIAVVWLLEISTTALAGSTVFLIALGVVFFALLVMIRLVWVRVECV